MVFQRQKQIPNCNYKYRTKTLDFFNKNERKPFVESDLGELR